MDRPPFFEPHMPTNATTTEPLPFPERAACRLCPHECGVNRLAGQAGFCGAGVVPRVFRHGPHFGEEPPISGTHGSGTVFFSHCTMRCVYCQNYPWSQLHQGENLEIPQLTEIFRTLAEKGCHNWNLVSPTPWLPQIRAALEPLIRDGIRRPFVYNSSGFESPKTLASFRDLADIALVDLRYSTTGTAREASACPEYVEAARATLDWCWRELGPLQCDDDGIATRGTICRVLVLPGHAQEAVDSLRWLADTLGNTLHVSVMAQYTPVHQARTRPEWNRRITPEEYESVKAAAGELGFDNGWIQDYKDAAEPADLLGCNMPAGETSVGKKPGENGRGG